MQANEVGACLLLRSSFQLVALYTLYSFWACGVTENCGTAMAAKAALVAVAVEAGSMTGFGPGLVMALATNTSCWGVSSTERFMQLVIGVHFHRCVAAFCSYICVPNIFVSQQ